jgi:hypothetical protein
LIILDQAHKPRTPDDYDKIVCAEVPDKNLNPRLYDTIITNMMHGPCNERCLDEHGKCTKRYPRDLCAATTNSNGSYPIYKRSAVGDPNEEIQLADR